MHAPQRDLRLVRVEVLCREARDRLDAAGIVQQHGLVELHRLFGVSDRVVRARHAQQQAGVARVCHERGTVALDRGIGLIQPQVHLAQLLHRRDHALALAPSRSCPGCVERESRVRCPEGPKDWQKKCLRGLDRGGRGGRKRRRHAGKAEAALTSLEKCGRRKLGWAPQTRVRLKQPSLLWCDANAALARLAAAAEAASPPKGSFAALPQQQNASICVD
eukprot:354229-Chlamydomonas_euryale.AAC.5